MRRPERGVIITVGPIPAAVCQHGQARRGESSSVEQFTGSGETPILRVGDWKETISRCRVLQARGDHPEKTWLQQERCYVFFFLTSRIFYGCVCLVFFFSLYSFSFAVKTVPGSRKQSTAALNSGHSALRQTIARPSNWKAMSGRHLHIPWLSEAADVASTSDRRAVRWNSMERPKRRRTGFSFDRRGPKIAIQAPWQIGGVFELAAFQQSSLIPNKPRPIASRLNVWDYTNSRR